MLTEPRTRAAIAIPVAILALIGFVVLAAVVHAHAVLPIDVAVTRAVQAVPLPFYQWVLIHVSDLGFGLAGPLAYVVIFVLLVAIGRRRDAVLAVASVLLASGLGGAIKIAIGRPRPSAAYVHVMRFLGDKSFPSGHVIHYTVLFGFAFYVLRQARPRSLWRDAVLVALALLVALVGPSRVYRGEHWPTDVLGGYLLAGLWLAGAILLSRALAARRRLPQTLHRDVDADEDAQRIEAEGLRSQRDAQSRV